MMRLFLVLGITLAFVSKVYSQKQCENYITVKTDSCCKIYYADTSSNNYLLKFRNNYRLSEIISNHETDLDKALALLHWTNSLWNHSGGNSAEVKDAFYILEKVNEGERFSCSEFAIVLTTAVNSVGIKARNVNLKCKNAETAQSGAGHSLSEVYISEYDKWVLFDPQNDVVAFYDSIPLSAQELKCAVYEYPERIDYIYKGEWVNKEFGQQITNWFKPYLYFFDIAFDNRYNQHTTYKCAENERLFLVPNGEEAPKVFQVNYPLNGYLTTHSVADFYQKPD